jgi:MarR family transcriptional regulator, lower aerobic nicotinate degradation pathway regulator
MTIDTKIDTKMPPPRLPAELVASNVFLLKRLGFAAKTRSMEVYEREGLNPYHYAILALLDEGVPETQAAIADALGYDRGTLVGLLDELEEKDLVERKRDPDDRRRHLVRLTGEGKRTLGRLRMCAKKVEDEFLAPLDAEQRQQLHELLLELAERHEPRCAPLS